MLREHASHTIVNSQLPNICFILFITCFFFLFLYFIWYIICFFKFIIVRLKQLRLSFQLSSWNWKIKLSWEDDIKWNWLYWSFQHTSTCEIKYIFLFKLFSKLILMNIDKLYIEFHQFIFVLHIQVLDIQWTFAKIKNLSVQTWQLIYLHALFRNIIINYLCLFFLFKC